MPFKNDSSYDEMLQDCFCFCLLMPKTISICLNAKILWHLAKVLFRTQTLGESFIRKMKNLCILSNPIEHWKEIIWRNLDSVFSLSRIHFWKVNRTGSVCVCGVRIQTHTDQHIHTKASHLHVSYFLTHTNIESTCIHIIILYMTLSHHIFDKNTT